MCSARWRRGRDGGRGRKGVVGGGGGWCWRRDGLLDVGRRRGDVAGAKRGRRTGESSMFPRSALACSCAANGRGMRRVRVGTRELTAGVDDGGTCHSTHQSHSLRQKVKMVKRRIGGRDRRNPVIPSIHPFERGWHARSAPSSSSGCSRQAGIRARRRDPWSPSQKACSRPIFEPLVMRFQPRRRTSESAILHGRNGFGSVTRQDHWMREDSDTPFDNQSRNETGEDE